MAMDVDDHALTSLLRVVFELAEKGKLILCPGASRRRGGAGGRVTAIGAATRCEDRRLVPDPEVHASSPFDPVFLVTPARDGKSRADGLRRGRGSMLMEANKTAARCFREAAP
jgi:hypothetical protein